MKKLALLPLFFLIAVLLLSVIGCAVQGSSNTIAQEQQGDMRFEGEWVISDYQEGGNKTLKYDGDIVKISKKNNIYYIEGPNDWFFVKTNKFSAEKYDLLVGRYVPNFDDIKEMYGRSASENLLANAIGKIVLKGTLSMQRNGMIIVKYNYWQIITSNGRFERVKETPGFYEFVLTRNKESAINARNVSGVTPLEARDNRFVAHGNGTVLDTRTNLMWAAKDNGSRIDSDDAKAYCKNYRGGGYKDWRMPTQDERAGLYDATLTDSRGFHKTYLIELTDCCPWASETSGSIVAPFNFEDGYQGWTIRSQNGARALPVRSGK